MAVAAALSFGVLVACAKNPDIAWAQAQEAYNSASAYYITLRAPCVDIGPDAPDCVIGDTAAGIIDPIFDKARAALDEYWETKNISWLDIAKGYVEDARAKIVRLVQ